MTDAFLLIFGILLAVIWCRTLLTLIRLARGRDPETAKRLADDDLGDGRGM